jgi:hypothetical protein
MIKLMCESCKELFESYVLPCYGQPMICKKCSKAYHDRIKEDKEKPSQSAIGN